MNKLARFLVLISIACSLTLSMSAMCDEGAVPLFSCETERAGKFIAICAVEEAAAERWSAVQYRFGTPDSPDLVFPTEPGAPALFFSHRAIGDDYQVTIRFTNGGYTYRLYSSSARQEAGVRVTDSHSRTVSSIRCAERPLMFPAYLRAALACDLENQHGRAACGEAPYRNP